MASRWGRQIPPDPSQWACDETGATENLWLNLSTGFIGSGRQVSLHLTYLSLPPLGDLQPACASPPSAEGGDSIPLIIFQLC